MGIGFESYSRPVTPDLIDGVREVVERNPRLKPLHDAALRDNSLNMSEVSAIIQADEEQKAENN